VIPSTGIGLGLRWSFAAEAAERSLPDCLRFFEITPENYIGLGGPQRDSLQRVARRRPLLSHSVSLNLGGLDPIDELELERLRSFLNDLGIQRHSDHLCWTAHDGATLHELLPLPWSAPAARRIAGRIKTIRHALGVPIAVENVTAYGQPGPSTLSEPEFITAVVEGAECGWLLDVHNLWVNAQNLDFDPLAWLEAAPLDRVTSMHVAGGRVRPDLDGLWIDDHSAPVPDAVISLMQHVLERVGEVPVCYERDNEIPALGELFAEVERLDAAYRDAVGTRRHGRSARAVPPADASVGLDHEDVSLIVIPRLAKVLRDASAESSTTAGIPARRVEVIRSLVRESLHFAPSRLLPRTAAARGAAFADDVDAWVRECGPRSPRLRDLAHEFFAWVRPRWEAPGAAVDEVPWLIDVARFELTRHRVLTQRVTRPEEVGPIDPDRAVVMASAEVLELGYAVHRGATPPVPTTLQVLVWRSRGAQLLEVDAHEAQLLRALLSDTSLSDAISAGFSVSAPISDDVLTRVSELLAELAAGGCVLGGRT
jgi:uncharacterized protein (UPF0276 family)